MTLAHTDINFSITISQITEQTMDSTGTVEDPLGHDALPSPTTELVCIIPQITEHIPMSFKVSGLFDPTLDLVNVLPDLTNENLFDNQSADSVGKAAIMKPSSRLLG